MQTVLDILKRAGGWQPGLSLKIEHQPYMSLVIEAMDESGPCGLPALSVPHYGEQNGDPMRDPEMCFELGFAGGAHPARPPSRTAHARSRSPRFHSEGRPVGARSSQASQAVSDR